MSKELERIAAQIRKCKRCDLWRTRKKAVPGEGNSQAKIFFVGEAPGKTEDETGRPFVGQSGRLLTNLLDAAGIKRKDVFITSCLKCRPPGNRKPKEIELKKCRPYIERQITAIKPKLIVLLGGVAIKRFIGDARIGQIHGKLVRKDGRLFLPTYHPAAARRFPGLKKPMVADFKKIKKEGIGRLLFPWQREGNI